MKRKIFLTLGILLSVCLLQFASCSSGDSNPSPEEVMQKINSGQTLDNADYYAMLDYLEEFVERGESGDGSYEDGQAIGHEYPYFMAFAIQLDNAPAEIANDSHYKNVVERFLQVMQ